MERQLVDIDALVPRERGVATASLQPQPGLILELDLL